ncbi:C-X-C motif chemokine 10 [Melanotaenia boesemani]|uniref:C-X-C motif chemokine 10 n=1 Tax=Melanotaenia boesemani TaxID=1250792 RepID=UPI001C049D4A|nr:C-X-C motif chemokine 10 [Melanotaenia boesemani]
MSKPLLLLAALLLCCCISSLQAFPRQGCNCIRTVSSPVPLRTIMKVEVVPPSGRCRWVERIITRKNGSKVCIDPKATWFPQLLSLLEKQKINSATQMPPASTTF